MSILHPFNSIPRNDTRYTLLRSPHTSDQGCLPQLIRGIDFLPVYGVIINKFQYHSAHEMLIVVSYTSTPQEKMHVAMRIVK